MRERGEREGVEGRVAGGVGVVAVGALIPGAPLCPAHKRRPRVAFPCEIAYGPAMDVMVGALSGAVLLAVRLSEEARGIRGLDVLRRSVDRAPPVVV